ncbi:MAG TPA: tRNA (adenosine(37)-N6)-threonylcarbamoyltransferase complex ATPase subunit type 1 TsaE [candidate division Zixibacteria bacterium]
MVSHKTKSPEETRDFGKDLSRKLNPGSVVALTGPLGSGKTVLVQGICAGLGVEKTVTSPTFVIINEYPGSLNQSPIWVYHFDLYRLESVEEFLGLGYEEYFYGKGITLIEWAEKIKEFLPKKRMEINLKILSESEREICIENI